MARNVWTWPAVLGGLLAVSVLGGCAPKALTGQPVDLYAVQGGLRSRPAPHLEPAAPAIGPETPYVPVMKPPRVQRGGYRPRSTTPATWCRGTGCTWNLNRHAGFWTTR